MGIKVHVKWFTTDFTDLCIVMYILTSVPPVALAGTPLYTLTYMLAHVLVRLGERTYTTHTHPTTQETQQNKALKQV